MSCWDKALEDLLKMLKASKERREKIVKKGKK